MKEIKLVPALELGSKLNVDVIDFPEGRDAKAGQAGTADGAADKAAEGASGGAAGGTYGGAAPLERKRCGITLDYSRRDIRELQDRGMDREAMLAYYKQRIYDLVKVNISQDWECVGGMEEVLAIVAKYIDAAEMR